MVNHEIGILTLAGMGNIELISKERDETEAMCIDGLHDQLRPIEMAANVPTYSTCLQHQWERCSHFVQRGSK